MAHVDLIQYEQASEEVKEVFDDIKNLRKIPDVNNFWKCLAHHPPTLKRTWESLKDIMAPGSLDSLTKEMIYVAVSASNGCEYCMTPGIYSYPPFFISLVFIDYLKLVVAEFLRRF